MAASRTTRAPARQVFAAVTAAVILAIPITLAQGSDVETSTLDRIRATGQIRLGYRLDAKPFSYGDESGQPAGYAVSVCDRIAAAVRSAVAPAASIRWVPVTAMERFDTVRRRDIDLLCSADSVTLARRGVVSFSIPIFPGGIGAMVRSDAPLRLRQVLAGRGQTIPNWRASAARTLQARAFTAVAGTTGETWLAQRFRDLQVHAERNTVGTYKEGLARLVSRRSDVLFGERAILLDAAHRDAAAADLVVIERQLTSEPLALALRRGDEDFRLFVDAVVSRLFRSGEVRGLYESAFGVPDEHATAFFRAAALPE